MGALLKLIDVTLFLCFLVVTLAMPLIHFQDLFPIRNDQIPGVLVDLKSRYTGITGDYLVVERPPFYVGLVWLQLLILWPLSLANLFGIFASKSWFSTTCLIYGVSVSSGMAAVFPELTGSGKATDNLLRVYSLFWGFGALAFLRGLLANCPSHCQTKSATAADIKKPALARKKRA